ncbi:MAG TPA: exodeoxyribonuclease VII large subunit [Gemmatimonadaceae bacterium]|nr:exodeoxyribonuclease VII large subunit [Gemmatimonadaceae bacterium]
MSSRRGTRRDAANTSALDLFTVSDCGAEPRGEAVGGQHEFEEPPAPEFVDGYPGETAGSAIAVETLTRTAKDVIEGAFIPLWVRGEISDFKSHRNGHWYFCLRDSRAQIRAVVWKGDQRGIPAAPDDGMQVAAFGRLSVYAARGEMQFTVTKIEAEGDGLRRKALEITRARLAADGLLAPERKRALPRFPRVVAVITSPDGAALHDIVAVMRRRSADVRLVVVPAAVQGETAVEELCFALDQVNRWGGADLVIVGRGGGSREDLWAFNDERVARAVAACHAPTISAVGHEVDFSICDLVADHRAPTPSAAAEVATFSRAELHNELRKVSLRLGGATRAILRDRADAMRHLGRDLAAAAAGQVAVRQTALQSVAGRLNALSPLSTLARGYSVARGADGSTLTSVDSFTGGTAFELIVRDGVVPARVEGTPRRTAS